MDKGAMLHERFHFVFAADERFLLQFKISVASLFLSLFQEDNKLTVDVLDCGISSVSWRDTQSQLLVLAERFRIDVSLQRHKIDMRIFEGLQTWNSSRAAYARILLPQLLAEECSCVYSDCDVLFLESPMEIFRHLKSSRSVVVGHRNPTDDYGVNPDIDWFVKNGEPCNEDKYFCSGLIGMDLVRFREMEATKHIMDFLRRHPHCVSVDQTALNWFCRDSISLLPDGWGVFPHECKDVKPLAIHYSGGMPWHGYPSWYEWVMWHDIVDLWHDVAEQVLGVKTRRQFEKPSVVFLGRIAESVLSILAYFPFAIPGTVNILKDFRASKRARDFLVSARRRILALSAPHEIN